MGDEFEWFHWEVETANQDLSNNFTDKVLGHLELIREAKYKPIRLFDNRVLLIPFNEKILKELKLTHKSNNVKFVPGIYCFVGPNAKYNGKPATRLGESRNLGVRVGSDHKKFHKDCVGFIMLQTNGINGESLFANRSIRGIIERKLKGFFFDNKIPSTQMRFDKSTGKYIPKTDSWDVASITDLRKLESFLNEFKKEFNESFSGREWAYDFAKKCKKNRKKKFD